MKALSLLLSAVCLLSLAACTSAPKSARQIVEAQTPGTVAGAGASFVGPANSAAPSSHVAERRTTWAPPVQVPPPALPAPAVPVIRIDAPALPTPSLPQSIAPSIAQPYPVSTYERTETTLGEHQDAAGIAKVAATMSKWSSLRWIGFTCILLGLGGLLWSYNNDHGYPLVFIKLAGLGVFFLLVGDNPLWLLLLIIPVGFYAVQKLNLLRI